MKKYLKKVILANLKKYPLISSLAGQAIRSYIGTSDEFLENRLIRDLYFGRRKKRADEFEEFLKNIREKTDNNSFRRIGKRLRSNFDNEFENIYAELRGAHYLINNCNAYRVEFLKQNGDHRTTDIKWTSTKGTHYAEIKHMGELEPYFYILVNKLEAESILNDKFCANFSIFTGYIELRTQLEIEKKVEEDSNDLMDILREKLEKGVNKTFSPRDLKISWIERLEVNYTEGSRFSLGLMPYGQDTTWPLERRTFCTLINGNTLVRIIDNCTKAYYQLKAMKSKNLKDDRIILFPNLGALWNIFGRDMKEVLTEIFNYWQISKFVTIDLIL